jgi:hypothetical protein
MISMRNLVRTLHTGLHHPPSLSPAPFTPFFRLTPPIYLNQEEVHYNKYRHSHTMPVIARYLASARTSSMTAELHVAIASTNRVPRNGENLVCDRIEKRYTRINTIL